MTTQTVLRIDDLRVRFAGRAEEAVAGVSLDVSAGEVVALVGESGSGKSVTSFSVMGLLPGTATASGSIRVADRDGEREIIGSTTAELDDVRGRVVSMVFQEPMTALNPTMTLGAQIAEAVRNHTSATKAEAAERAVELMRQVGIPDPERRAKQFPHEFSGGQRQRVVIAIALACEPRLIIADEPTTALDVTVQAEILDLLRTLVRERGVGVLIITHNMGVVADLADRVFVMRHGRVVESGPAERVLTTPDHDYTRTLLAAIPELPPAAFGGAGVAGEAHAFDEPANPVISMRGVTAGYRVSGRFVPAVHDIDLAVGQGEFVGLVGESGSGKSTVSRLALGLLPAHAGEISLLGQPLGSLRGRAARRLLRDVGVVFQDPGGSLDPRMTVGESIAEPLAIHGRGMSRADKRARVAELLDAVRLPKDAASRYPHEFSGGQRQRVGLARALVLKPRLLVADEPTSALDVSVQAEVLDVLRVLHEELEFGCLFVSHDLGVVNQLTQRVVVMRRGRIVEQGPTSDVLRAPRELYTQELLASVPSPDPVAQRQRRAARAGLLEK
ncbi:glutathione ABC transporter ATP-binding protein [Microbacterium nanhaiense]|uniref:Glutathione ABC transporter ATP-binding protein n=1 Tax=Microbacterium nanhaiense TaxID=1301026 RepID=A0ABQ2N0F8_9MICO|nr:ABC transporter ATP-binding protein [Microbacterium nanhaiense]GGO63280.1 glutathione ABC transporter ATP-binding protein [Microbacterium nanhaiense]